MENRKLSKVSTARSTESTRTDEEVSRSTEHGVQSTGAEAMKGDMLKLDMNVVELAERISVVEKGLSDLEEAEGQLTGTDQAETQLQKLMLKIEERLIRLEERYSRIRERNLILKGDTKIHERIPRAERRYLSLAEKMSKAEDWVSQSDDLRDQQDKVVQILVEMGEQQLCPRNDTTLNHPAKAGKSSSSRSKSSRLIK